MITEDYVSFEVAKLLKEKGFDEPCSSTYDTAVSGGKPIFYKYDVLHFFPNGMKNSDDKYGMVISAPTHQMAMKWLREAHNIHIEIYVIKNYDKEICKYTYTIMDLNFPGSDDGIDCCNEYKTYEQACELAIKYCLKRLVW